MISKSFEMSEIINNRDQSALLDHMKDISFLMSGHKDNNDKNSERLNIGAKPKRIWGSQKELMDRLLYRKREIHQPIVNKNIKVDKGEKK